MRRRGIIVVAVVALAFVVGVVLLRSRGPEEPVYEGKLLSTWLDELRAVEYWYRHETNRKPVQAIRAMGTNAIPWLLHEYRDDRIGVWKWKLNEFLKKRKLMQIRVSSADERLSRATTGFRALGPLGEPAIPMLMKGVEEVPGYIPAALAGIGKPAIPALQQCLTNDRLYTNSVGVYAILPGNTISEIFNARSFGILTKNDTAVFLPVIHAWARQTTNAQAKRRALEFLAFESVESQRP